MGHETIIGLIVQVAIVIIFYWIQSTRFAQFELISGTLISLSILFSPFLELSPVGIRKYKSRLRKIQISLSMLRSETNVVANGGVAAGQGGVAIGGDLHGNVSIQNVKSHSVVDVYVATLIWILCILALPIIAIPLIALVLILSDAGLVIALGVILLAPTSLMYIIAIRPANIDAWLSVVQHILEQISIKQAIVKKIAAFGLYVILFLGFSSILFLFMALSDNFRHAVGWKVIFSNEVEFPLGDYGLKAVGEEYNGNYEAAIQYYKKALEVNPNNAAAYNGLAWLYIDKLDTNYVEAIYLAQKAVSLVEDLDPVENPHYTNWQANYLDTLGWAYYKNGDCNNALQNLEKSVELFPSKEFIKHLEIVKTGSAKDLLEISSQCNK